MSNTSDNSPSVPKIETLAQYIIEAKNIVPPEPVGRESLVKKLGMEESGEAVKTFLAILNDATNLWPHVDKKKLAADLAKRFGNNGAIAIMEGVDSIQLRFPLRENDDEGRLESIGKRVRVIQREAGMVLVREWHKKPLDELGTQIQEQDIKTLEDLKLAVVEIANERVKKCSTLLERCKGLSRKSTDKELKQFASDWGEVFLPGSPANFMQYRIQQPVDRDRLAAIIVIHRANIKNRRDKVHKLSNDPNEAFLYLAEYNDDLKGRIDQESFIEDLTQKFGSETAQNIMETMKYTSATAAREKFYQVVGEHQARGRSRIKAGVVAALGALSLAFCNLSNNGKEPSDKRDHPDVTERVPAGQVPPIDPPTASHD
ncbi:MAG: hypothetical protein KDI13_04920 [Alphaproteobacteria bacterium]|nr:hypothetical protein [Alphaproteobacteria bacterium]